ncbi:Ribosomal protein s6, partial [Globisporangium splendens]
MATSADSHDADDGAARDGSRIYVGNLTPKANEVHLEKLFVKFGVILSIWVARKLLCLMLISLFCVYVRVMDAGCQPPGFAFVHFETREAAQRAVDAFEDAKESGDHAMEILGKPVKVQMAGEKKKKKAESVQDQAVIADAREGCSTIAGETLAAVDKHITQSDRHNYSHERRRKRSWSSSSIDSIRTRHRRSRSISLRRSSRSSSAPRKSRSRSSRPDRRRNHRQTQDREWDRRFRSNSRETAVGIEDVGTELGAEVQAEVASTPGAADEDGLRRKIAAKHVPERYNVSQVR